MIWRSRGDNWVNIIVEMSGVIGDLGDTELWSYGGGCAPLNCGKEQKREGNNLYLKS